MKKILLLLIIPFLFFLTTKPAEAHFLATDGNIGAILHIDPNDQPIAGSQASFYFQFTDKQNKFQPYKCNCTFEIDENGKAIYTQSLFASNTQPSLSNASVFYTFPKIDVYEIKVIGKPITPNAFQPFTLIWYFRISDEAAKSGYIGSGGTPLSFFSTHLIEFIPLYLVVVGLIVFLIFKLLKTYKSGKGGEKKKHKHEEDHRDIY
jgi:hypothetical protein